MKKVFFAAAILSLALTSCSDDDNDQTIGNASIDGTWKVTEINLDRAVDLNGDGQATTSLIAETGCFNNSKLVFVDGTTAAITLEGVDFELAGTEQNPIYEIECDLFESAIGNYSVTQSTVNLLEEDGEAALVLIRANNTLVIHIPGLQAVPVGVENGYIDYDYVGATLIFTKQ